MWWRRRRTAGFARSLFEPFAHSPVAALLGILAVIVGFAGAFLLYHFIDATHVLGRLKVNNSDRLTMFTLNGTTLTAGATLDLAGSGSLLSVTNVGNTIYVASSAALQMIAFDPASGSLRAIATANTGASSIAVNPVTP